MEACAATRGIAGRGSYSGASKVGPGRGYAQTRGGGWLEVEEKADKRGPLVIDPKRERVRWGSGEHRQRAMGEAVACWACWAARRGPWQAGFSLTGRVALGLVLAREVRG